MQLRFDLGGANSSASTPFAPVSPSILSASTRSFHLFFFFSSRRRHTRWTGDWSSDVCSSDLGIGARVDHVTDRLLGQLPDLSEHLLRFVPFSRVDDHDAIVSELDSDVRTIAGEDRKSVV